MGRTTKLTLRINQADKLGGTVTELIDDTGHQVSFQIIDFSAINKPPTDDFCVSIGFHENGQGFNSVSARVSGTIEIEFDNKSYNLLTKVVGLLKNGQ